MQDVKLAVGKKIFSFKCDNKDLDKINSLSKELNLMVNRNILKYRGISEDNVFLLTVFELLDSINSISETNNSIQIKEIIKEVVINKQATPDLYHPYPQISEISGTKWSTDLFGYDLNTDIKAIESLIQKQEDIDKEVASIINYLNSVIIALANAENNNI